MFILKFSAIRTSISDDWSSTGFMEAAAELEGADRDKYKEKRDKERQKERAKVEKEKENDEGLFVFSAYKYHTVSISKIKFKKLNVFLKRMLLFFHHNQNTKK